MYLALYQTKLNWPMLKPSWARLIDWLKELKQENSEPWFHCASGNVFSGEEQIKHLEFFSPVWPAQCSQAAGSAERHHNLLWSYSLSRDTASVRRMSCFLISICNWLPTWQNCGHKALAGAASSVAKIRKTKALVLKKARKNLEGETTSLVIITTTQHHEEWILSLRSCLYSTSFSRKFSLPFFTESASLSFIPFRCQFVISSKDLF